VSLSFLQVTPTLNQPSLDRTIPLFMVATVDYKKCKRVSQKLNYGTSRTKSNCFQELYSGN